MAHGAQHNSGRHYTLDEAASLPDVQLGREALRQRVANLRIPGSKDEGGRWLIEADPFDAMVTNGELKRLRGSPRLPSRTATILESDADTTPGDVRWALAEQRVQSLEAEVRRLRRLVSDLTRAIDHSTTEDELDAPPP